MKTPTGHRLTRLLLNIIFTGVIMVAALNNNDRSLPVGFILLYNLLIFVPGWINNFWLFPNLLRNRKVKHYLISAAVLFMVLVIILGQYLQWLYYQFNTTELHNFTPLAATSSAPDILEKYQYYFDVYPGIIIVMVAMAIGYSVQEFLLKIKKEEHIRAQQAVAELSLLKSQISPHFLFNVLNSLYALSLKRSKETPDVILKLSDILRYSLYESQEKEISVVNEVHILNTYIEIERLRLPQNASISFLHHQVKDPVKIAPMLLLPLLENAFKHGTDSTIGISYIKASLSCDNTGLVFSCENSFKESAKKDFGGIGIENIRKRLELLYPSKYLFQIKKSKDMFSVTLKIKLQK